MDHKIATYKVIKDAGGNRYKFYCDLSSACVCTASVYKADTPVDFVLLAATRCFDRYKRQHSCCPRCDTVLAPDSQYCPNCGKQVWQISAESEKGGDYVLL